ncbi:uncharacterized protein LOC132611243 [Lycium barbarum]|uniref:uncharacterized protein LOC132611243 n=1 Tax=Lycium barbarum TaxID=112863 RepID=UPI00293F00B6|nr:uncharacterized protein LOC132611243 [Lycium barbarum]
MSHLGTFGFVPGYYCWYHHGESYPYPSVLNDYPGEALGETVNSQSDNAFRSMVFDVAGPSYDGNLEEDPSPTAQHLYDFLKASEQEIWAGNPHGHSQLSVVARLLNLKAEHHFSERLYDELCQFLPELVPTNNIMTYSFYNSELVNCKFCAHPRFKRSKHCRSKQKTNIPYKQMSYFPLTPRLQRLYASNATAKHMRWHSEHERDGVMCHPSDAPAWKHFDQAYPCFASESIAGKLACPYCKEDSDAFSLPNGRKVSWFDNHRKFLPSNHPWRRNKKWFKKGQTVHKVVSTEQSGLQILREIEDLGLMKVTELCSNAINARISKNSSCGWKKRSIFWDLPYWKTNLIRHNLDVMHIENNVFDNIFNTLMNVKGKTKDKAKSRVDLKLLCHRPELHQDDSTQKYPKACYMLDDNAK